MPESFKMYADFVYWKYPLDIADIKVRVLYFLITDKRYVRR